MIWLANRADSLLGHINRNMVSRIRDVFLLHTQGCWGDTPGVLGSFLEFHSFHFFFFRILEFFWVTFVWAQKSRSFQR